MQYKQMKSPLTNEILEDTIMKLLDNGHVMFIPNKEENVDWQEYLEWLALGNLPEPADEE